MASRKRAATVRQLQAAEASPSKVGQALGVHGINIAAFIAVYNTRSAAQRGLVVPVVVTVYDDRSFDLELRTPPTLALLAWAAGLPKGSGRPAPTLQWPSLPATSCARSPGPGSATSTPPTWTPPSGSSPAPPAPWASRWSTPNEPLKGRTGKRPLPPGHGAAAGGKPAMGAALRQTRWPQPIERRSPHRHRGLGGRSLLMLREQAGDQEQRNDGEGVSGMANHVEPGGIRTWYDEQAAGEPLMLLLVRGQATDRSRALELLEWALATADTMGMAAVAEGIRTLQATQAAQAGGPATAAPEAAAVAEAASNLFRREGEYWTVCYDGVVVRLRDAKGLRHLARLLADPGREFHVVDLEAADRQPAVAAVGPRGRAGAGELAVRPDLGDGGVLLDATAKAAYRTRLGELRAELEEAEDGNDPARASRARAERDFLVAELARAVGLGGRDRRAAAHAERARLNVTRAIRTAMANLARAHPSLGRHLAATVRTGRYCSYTPDPRTPNAWQR